MSAVSQDRAFAPLHSSMRDRVGLCQKEERGEERKRGRKGKWGEGRGEKGERRAERGERRAQRRGERRGNTA